MPGTEGGSTPQGGTESVAGTPSVAGNPGTSGSAGTAGAPPEVPDCDDEQKTVDETDVDCGGRTCAPCKTDERCAAGTDCESAICTNQICQAPTCTDLAVNGDETDMNCGGTCPGCELGQRCTDDDDCATKQCVEGICESATCQDGVLEDGCPLLIHNTPYALSPGHALGRCVDDDKQSVTEGNAMLLFSCKHELHQTFWAIASDGGYFAFRSALSGKCLQVRGKSLAENAIIEQGTCTYAPEQLWEPTRVDSSLMQLTNQLSGLALDVAGSSVDADFQGIVQGKVSGAADTHWRLERRTSAAYIAISPNDDKGSFIQHDGALVSFGSEDSPKQHWKILPGLQDARYISFQSRDEPGRYLRHASFRVWADTNDGSNQFKKDATFHIANPLVGMSALSKSFEANNFPGSFWLRDGNGISLTQNPDTPEFDSGATWWLSAR